MPGADRALRARLEEHLELLRQHGAEQLIGELARIMEADPQKVGPDEIVLSTGTAGGFIRGSLRTTTNPTLLAGGYKHNVIPDFAEALVDIRTLAGEEDAVLAEIRDLIGDEIEIVIMHKDIGLETPFEGPLVDAMVEDMVFEPIGADRTRLLWRAHYRPKGFMVPFHPLMRAVFGQLFQESTRGLVAYVAAHKVRA